jgi:dimeric dUTPase (all-alpha-NTP-PPase superfamily)
MDLTKMLADQKKLDEEILKNAGIKKYPLENIRVALLVELGELCNEDKTFKYWKKHREVNRERLLDEFADCLHFALSLENYYHENSVFQCDIDEAIKVRKNSHPTNEEIVEEMISTFRFVMVENNILRGVISFGIALGITDEEMEQAYYKKHKENYKRQQEGY